MADAGCQNPDIGCQSQIVNRHSILTHSQVLESIFTLLSFIKIPAPTIEYNTLRHFRFHPIYY